MLREPRRSTYTLISLALFFSIWSVLAFYFKETPMLFPAPLKVLRRMIEDYQLFVYHARMTFVEMLLGMLLAIVASFTTAYLMLKLRLVRFLLEPWFVVMQCLPMFVLAPLCVIWFGWSLVAIIVPTALMMTFPLTMNLYKGLSIASKQHVDFFKLHGASKRQLLFKIQLPFALPHLSSGLKIAAAVSGVGAVAGEWAGAQKGLGVLLQICKRNFDLEGVFGVILSLLMLSLSLYGIVVLLEKKWIRGQHELT
jgi:NitT/TauT family transport system substrate-binding protein